ncbi:HCLS1-binding protein 3 [Polypterus senegalus]|nr:HCLS1-binding protein 3 [Polypterus senegalus]
MPDGLITNRQIQNANTGIDLFVPMYQEIRGNMMTGHVEYQIVVVTRLSAFKSAKHKPEDVIQLVVSKKYSEIDEFYNRLSANDHGVSLPPMPRKALFVGEEDIKDRRAAFDEIMRFVSKQPTLARSQELLEFLGAKTTDVVDFRTTNKPEQEESESCDFFIKDEIPTSKYTQLVTAEKTAEEETEEILDPLGIIRSKKTKKSANGDKKVKPQLLLFDEEVDPDEDLFEPAKKHSSGKSAFVKHSDIKLFEDPDLGGTVKLGDSLLLPSACTVVNTNLTMEFSEETEELFRVDDFDKLLTLSTSTKPKPKPALKPKPTLLKTTPGLSKSGANAASVLTPQVNEKKADDMNEMDILKYIQQNESVSDDSLDLF